jgi:thioredoxin 1
VLVDFYADWCGPCQMLAPVLEELARETPSAKIVKVNVDQSRQLATRYGINAIPSVMVFREGKMVSRYTGLADKAQLQKMLNM